MAIILCYLKFDMQTVFRRSLYYWLDSVGGVPLVNLVPAAAVTPLKEVDKIDIFLWGSK